MCCVKLRYCGSMAEQLIRNEQVVSSILTSSSKLNPCKQCAYKGFLHLKHVFQRLFAAVCFCIILLTLALLYLCIKTN